MTMIEMVNLSKLKLTIPNVKILQMAQVLLIAKVTVIQVCGTLSTANI